MIQIIDMLEFSPQVRRIPIKDHADMPLMTLDARSYLVGGTAYLPSTDAHILVGRYSSLAHNLSFYMGLSHDHHAITTYPLASSFDGCDEDEFTTINRHQIIIGNDVWIGGDVLLMSGVHIGNGAVIGAGAVIAKDVPPYAVVVGNPARVIKYRFDAETIARLQRIKWWNLPQEEIEPLLLTYHNDMEGFLSHFDLPPQEAAQDETSAAIEQLRTQGYTVSYFIPDFEIPIPYCAWPRVIDSFLAAYTEQDRAALVVAMPEREDIHLYEEGIAARIRDYSDHTPLVLSHRCSSTMPFSIAALQSSNIYITTREPVCSHAVDYAADAGLTIRYGLDHGGLVFPPL